MSYLIGDDVKGVESTTLILAKLNCLPIYARGEYNNSSLTQKYSIIYQPFQPILFIIMPGDDLILVLWGELAEVAAPAPHPHDQVLMLFWIRFGIQQGF